jgi:hypothetical protein
MYNLFILYNNLVHCKLIFPCTFFILLVPMQLNGYDCGLFVCRYAVAFHKVIKDSIFTYKDLYYSHSPLLDKITNSDHFRFNQAVIDEF